MCNFPKGKKYTWKSILKSGETLYRYAKPKAFPDDQTEIPSSIFEDKNLSCDLARMVDDPTQSPHYSHGKKLLIKISVCGAIRNPKNPKRTGELVAPWHQTIIHDPLTEKENTLPGQNEAHSLIIGSKKKPVTDSMKRNSTWELLL